MPFRFCKILFLFLLLLQPAIAWPQAIKTIAASEQDRITRILENEDPTLSLFVQQLDTIKRSDSLFLFYRQLLHEGLSDLEKATTPSEREAAITKYEYAKQELKEEMGLPKKEPISEELLVFKPVAGEELFFDRPEHIAMRHKYDFYAVSKDKMILFPWKSMAINQPAQVEYEIKGTLPDGAKTIFKFNNELITPIGNKILIPAQSIEGDNQRLQAYITVTENGKTEEKLVGSLSIAVYKEKAMKVRLVAVNDAGIISELANKQAEILTYLNSAYKPANASWSIEVESEVLQVSLSSSDKFDAIEYDLIRNYSSGMKTVIQTWQNSPQATNNEENELILFFLKGQSTPLQGFMPLGYKHGFLFLEKISGTNEPAHTIAHELGHGAFKLRHPFDEFKTPQGSTNTLMDYAVLPTGGILSLKQNALFKYQWDDVHIMNVAILTWMQEMGDGAAKECDNRTISVEVNGGFDEEYFAQSKFISNNIHNPQILDFKLPSSSYPYIVLINVKNGRNYFNNGVSYNLNNTSLDNFTSDDYDAKFVKTEKIGREFLLIKFKKEKSLTVQIIAKDQVRYTDGSLGPLCTKSKEITLSITNDVPKRIFNLRDKKSGNILSGTNGFDIYEKDEVIFEVVELKEDGYSALDLDFNWKLTNIDNTDAAPTELTAKSFTLPTSKLGNFKLTVNNSTQNINYDGNITIHDNIAIFDCTGQTQNIYIDEDGTVLYSEEEGNSTYIIKTKRMASEMFIEDTKLEYIATVNGISSSEYEAAKNAIITAAASKLPVPENIKRQFVKIECTAVLQSMYVHVTANDNGKCVEDQANNTEYGGRIDNKTGTISPSTGKYANQCNSNNATIDNAVVHGFRTSFHSHPSGYARCVVGKDANNDNIYKNKYWIQPPSPQDITNHTYGNPRYVFSMKDKIVYVYDATGIIASFKFNLFENL